MVTAGAYDGAVYHLRPDIGGAVLKNYITPNGGEVARRIRVAQGPLPGRVRRKRRKALARLLEENEVLVAAIAKELEEHATLVSLPTR